MGLIYIYTHMYKYICIYILYRVARVGQGVTHAASGKSSKFDILMFRISCFFPDLNYCRSMPL